MAELRRQIAIEQSAKIKKETKVDPDVPTEFECCFCTNKVCGFFSIYINIYLIFVNPFINLFNVVYNLIYNQ